MSQLIRSSGIIFTSDYIKGKKCYGAKIIPNRGAWLEIESDINQVIHIFYNLKSLHSTKTRYFNESFLIP